MTKYDLFQTLHFAGVAIYGLTAAGCWLAIGLAKDPIKKHRFVRMFLKAGPVLGLSLGALIFGGLGTHYLDFGGFIWSLETPESQQIATKHLLFLVFWVSHFHLEIWTQEPLRTLERTETKPDYEAWTTATRPVWRQLSFNILLFAGLGAYSL